MSVSDLTNTKWVFNNMISLSLGVYNYAINFVSNNTNFSRLAWDPQSGLNYNNTEAFSDLSGGWTNTAYRIIQITDGTDATNSTLISWLEENATQAPVVDLTGTEWVFNDQVNVWDNGYPYGDFDIDFSSNGSNYATIYFAAIYDDVSGMLLNTVQYNATTVFGKAESPVPSPVPIPQVAWIQEGYKTISISSGSDVTNPSLIEVLSKNATLQTATQLSVDLTTLSGWSDVSAGSHTLKVKAKATGYRDSALSSGVSFEKSGGSLPTPKASLNDYTLEEIQQLSFALVDNTISASDLSSTYHIAIGDTKQITAAINNETHSYRLTAVKHDLDINGDYAGMTFEQVDLMVNTYAMKSSMSSTDSWQNSDLKTTLEGFAVNPDLAAVIKPVKKVCANNVSSGTPTYNYINTTNGLFIASETEVFGTQNYTIGGTVEGSQYEWYANGGSAIKQRSGSNDWWWLRSPEYWSDKKEYSGFAVVLDGGSVDGYSSDDDDGVAPCFCI